MAARVTWLRRAAAAFVAAVVCTACDWPWRHDMADQPSLQTATSNPAKFLEMEKDYGSVARGKIADLVLLEANPLDNIRNTQKISAVIANGRLFDRHALNNMLLEIQTAARTLKAN